MVRFAVFVGLALAALTFQARAAEPEASRPSSQLVLGLPSVVLQNANGADIPQLNQFMASPSVVKGKVLGFWLPMDSTPQSSPYAPLWADLQAGIAKQFQVVHDIAPSIPVSDKVRVWGGWISVPQGTIYVTTIGSPVPGACLDGTDLNYPQGTMMCPMRIGYATGPSVPPKVVASASQFCFMQSSINGDNEAGFDNANPALKTTIAFDRVTRKLLIWSTSNGGSNDACGATIVDMSSVVPPAS